MGAEEAYKIVPLLYLAAKRNDDTRVTKSHVVADALTSVMAIIARLFGKYVGGWWLDPIAGIDGALVIATWAWGMFGRSGDVLIHRSQDRALEAEVKTAIEANADNSVAALLLWRIGPGHWAAIVSLVTWDPRPASHYRDLLAGMHELSYITVEVKARH